MLEKTMRMSNLYDFYHPLLTEKQRQYMALYYMDDYSLGEVAEQFHVSRQAVHDTLRRTEAMLEDFEEKLGLLARFQRRSGLLEQLRSLVQADGSSDNLFDIIDALENLE
ncbi:MAG TPA: putative DNA-binding protein [Bacillales bacterium]|nr:putative DNA-binding protein [Bacillales bacterium]